MLQKPKVIEIVDVLAVLVFGTLILTIGVTLAFIPAEGGRVMSPLLGVYKIGLPSAKSSLANALLWLCMPLIALLVIEAGLWRLRLALAMREEKLMHQFKTFWSKLGQIDQYVDLLRNSCGLLLILLIFAGVAYELLHYPRAVSLNTVLFFTAILVHILTRKGQARVLARFSKWMRQGQPTYMLTEDGVTIKLMHKIVHIGNKERFVPPPVHIRFAEIELMQTFTYAEAQAFLEYKIGPDLELAARQTRDLYRYYKGEIPRPSVYTIAALSTNGKPVLIKGPELFYLMQFATDDVADLVEAYRSFKSK